MQRKKVKKILLLCLGLLAAAFAVILAAGMPKWVHKDNVQNQVVYVKDHLLYYTADVKENQTAAVISQLEYEKDMEWIYYWGDGIRLSEDGKYVYFLTGVDKDGKGELCRIKTDKICMDEAKNALYIERLDKDIVRYQILENPEQVVYMQEDGRLLYLRDITEFIGKPVNDFYVCEDQVIYTVKQENSAEEENLYTIYAYGLETGRNVALEEGIHDFYRSEKADFIPCTKMSRDGESTIYLLDANGESKKIAENAAYYLDGLDGEKKEFYYSIAEKQGQNTVADIYKYEDGKKPVKILDDVAACDVDAKHGLCIFCKMSEESAKPQFYYRWGELEGALDIEDADGFWFAVSEDEQSVMLCQDDEEGALVLYEKTADGLEKKKEMDKHTSLAAWSGNTCYYYANVDKTKQTGDLYCYEDGKSTKCMQNVYMNVKLYPDDYLLAYKGHGTEDGSTLSLYPAMGEEVEIAEHVKEFTYLGKESILYVADGSLYVYTGEEAHVVDRNVIGYRCHELQGEYL